MESPDRRGPSSSARWERRVVGGASVGETDVLALADAGNEAEPRPLYHCLPPAPRLARTPAGDPLLTLTVVLSRQPDARDETIQPLIEGGTLGVTFSLALPDVATAVEQYDPLFCASAVFELVQEDHLIASAEAAGVAPRAALSISAGRELASSILTALDTRPSGLEVRARVRFRCAPGAITIRIDGSAREVYDILANHCDAEGRLTPAELRAAVAAMLEVNAIRIESGGAELEPETVYDAFRSLSAVVLSRDGDGFVLRRRPHAFVRLQFEKTIVAPATREVTLHAPLEDVIGGAARSDPDRFVHLVAPSGNGKAFTAVPRLVRSTVHRGPVPEPPLARRGSQMTSLSLALTPDTSAAPRAHAFIAGDAARISAVETGRVQSWLASDVVLASTASEQKLSLPIVEDASKPVFHDRTTASKLWYVPSFVLERPAPSDDPATSAFAFTFAQSGTTASGAPGLNGKARFRLRQVMSEATRNALRTMQGTAVRVPCSNVSVVLEVPFRDSARGTTAVQKFVGEVQSRGDTFEVSVSQIDDWVRLAYGALAYAGFQAQPARLRIAYAFRAFVPIRRNPALIGEKIAMTTVVASMRDMPDDSHAGPVFNAAEGTIRSGNSEVRLRLERARPAPLLMTGISLHAAAVQQLAVQQPIVHVAPVLQVSPTLVAATNVRYATQTIVREEVVDVFFPCTEFGGLYLQTNEQPPRRIGCAAALKLGEIAYRQYEELVALRHPRYTVHRSLQQPGRFLIVPEAYRITRYGPSEGAKAYRTAAMIFALVETDAAKSRYHLAATLEPDIPAVERQRLMRRIAPHVPFGATAMFDFPTAPAVQAKASYRFAVPAGIAEPSVLQVLDTLQVSVSTDLTNALTLTSLIETSGLIGVATFELPDGTLLQSSLVVDTHAIGPASGGPVSVEISGTTATLTNRIEQTVNVVDLVVARGNTEQSVRVDRSLAPGTPLLCVLPFTPDAAGVTIADSSAPVSLRQLDLFVEDVFTNVIFVNLIHHANHGLRALKLEARLKGSPETHVLDLAEGQHKVLNFTVALSSYLEQQILEYRFLKTVEGSTPLLAGPLREWDLKAAGNVVSVTWDSVA
jgi:hypothetical protein